MAWAILAGFGLGASLIIAIGAQNAFLLRQGLKGEHVGLLVAVFAGSDAALIAAGVGGLGTLVEGRVALLAVITVAGALFLVAYGLMALRRALRADGRLVAEGGAPLSPRRALATALAFTFLNPHVYLDTVVLIGAIASTYSGDARLAFGIGAATASLVWFVALGYGAARLRPIFARPGAWRILDAGIAAIMFALAGALLLDIRRG